MNPKQIERDIRITGELLRANSDSRESEYQTINECRVDALERLIGAGLELVRLQGEGASHD